MTNEIKRNMVMASEEMTEIKIPIDERNPGDKIVPIGINGKFWHVTRGERTKVPRAVCAILENAKYI